MIIFHIYGEGMKKSRNSFTTRSAIIGSFVVFFKGKTSKI